MPSTEKNNIKKKSRFNIIDLLIIIVIIAAVATVAVRLDLADKIVQATAEDSASYYHRILDRSGCGWCGIRG